MKVPGGNGKTSSGVHLDAKFSAANKFVHLGLSLNILDHQNEVCFSASRLTPESMNVTWT